jgi:NodT family efflux transporter outer membrane factor (OMF) lipoprotein
MRPRTRTIRALAAAISAVASIQGGCAVGPDFERPATPQGKVLTAQPLPESTVMADGRVQRFAAGEKVAADWWRLLSCPELDAIVVESIARNPSLDVARASLRMSQDTLRAGYGVFFPHADVAAGANRELYNPAPGIIPVQGAASSPFNLFTVSASVSYALDVWGGQRRALEGLRAQVDDERYTLAGTYVMLSGNVVNTVIAQAGYRAQIDATLASIALQKEQLRITQAQALGGTVPYANVLTIQSQLASTEATLPPLEQKIDQAADLLATLAGQTPAEWKQPRVALADLKLPPDLPQSLPSEIVRQRPDVLVAEALLHAANASIGVATAAMLPNVTLSAGYGVAGTAAGSGPFWSLGAGLTQPIFDAGTLWYQRKAAIDAHDASLAAYKQTVLGAFEQVADTLRGLQHDAESLKAQTEAVETAEGAMRLIQANYAAGVSNYLQVLVADGQYLLARIGYVQAVAQRLQDTVALYVALGGGWWNAPIQSLVATAAPKDTK